MRIRENIPLRELTTLGVGGPARFLIEAGSEDDVVRAAAFAAEKDLPLFVLGGGSNVLVADEGFRGAVLRVRLEGIFERSLADAGMPGIAAGPSDSGGAAILEVAAGEPWDRLVAWSVERDLVGLECLSGIPGSAGATPIQNVGAYGQEVSETIACVRALDRSTGRWVDLVPADCGFGYRSSIFNTIAKERYVVVAVTFRLPRGGAPRLSYGELRDRFTTGTLPRLRDVREAVMTIRRRKGTLLEPGDPEAQSAGSFFKNPIVTEARCREIEEAAGQAPPAFVAGSGRVKLPAAWLIERAGIQRGLAHGGAGVSTRHALALVNRGTASARDLLDLAGEIRRAVAERFDITLDLEPVLLGFESGV